MLTGGWVVIVSGALAASSAVGAPAIVSAQTGEPLAIVTPFGFIPDFIEMMNAISGGHLARQGFAAKLAGGTGQSQALQQLVAGQVAFTRSAAIDQIRAVSATGAPLVSISTLYQGSTFNLLSHRDRPIRSAEEFKGKTIGIVSVGGTTDIFLDVMLFKAGLKPADVKREVTGNSPGAFQILKAGRIDGFMCSNNVLVTLERTGEPVSAWSTDRYAPMPSQGYVTTKAMVDTKPETLTRIMRAMRASVEEIMTQPLRPIYERAAKEFEIPGLKDLETVVAVETVAIEKLWVSEGRENLLRNVPRLWTGAVETLREAGLTTLASADGLYTNRFVDAAA